MQPDTDRAVSPVIGVILMVAVTIILAAIVATFALDIVSLQEEPNAVIEVDNSDNESIITVQRIANSDGVALVAANGSVVDYTNVTGGFIVYDYDSRMTIQAYIGDIQVNKSISKADVSGVIQDIEPN